MFSLLSCFGLTHIFVPFPDLGGPMANCTATDLPRVESPMVPSCHSVNQPSHLLFARGTTAEAHRNLALHRDHEDYIYVFYNGIVDFGMKADVTVVCTIRLAG